MPESIIWVFVPLLFAFFLFGVIVEISSRHTATTVLFAFGLMVCITAVGWDIQANLALRESGYPIVSDKIHDLITDKSPDGITQQYIKIETVDPLMNGRLKDTRLKNVAVLFGGILPENCRIQRIVYDRRKCFHWLLLHDSDKVHKASAIYRVIYNDAPTTKPVLEKVIYGGGMDSSDNF